MTEPSRRSVLATCGTALALGVTGCISDGDDAGPTERGTSPPPTSDPGTDATDPTTGDDTTTTGGQYDDPTPSDSRLRWQVNVRTPVSTSPPVLAPESVLVGTKGGTLRALSRETGGTRFKHESESEVRAVAAPDEGIAAVAITGSVALSSSHTLRGIDAEGREQWSFSPTSWWLSLVGVDGGTVYVATGDDALSGDGQRLYALDAASGEEQWSAVVGDTRDALVTDDSVYVSSYGRVYAYDRERGETRWSRETGRLQSGVFAAVDDVLVYAREREVTETVLTARDAASGDLVWEFDDWFVTSATEHDGTLYTGGERVAAFDPASGERRWRTEDNGFVPDVPVRDGRLFAGGDAVRALSTADGSEAWTWTPEVEQEGFVPAGVADGTLFVEAWQESDPRDQYRFGVDAATGESRWAFADGTELTGVAVGERAGYLGGGNGQAYALRSQ